MALKKILWLCVLCVLGACSKPVQQSAPTSLSSDCQAHIELRAAIKNGVSLVVVIQHVPDSDELASEAYADWHYYLEDFLNEHKQTLKVFSLSPDQAPQVFVNSEILFHNRSLLFININKKDWYFEDQILEPQPYMVLESLMNSDEPPKNLSEFFPELVSPELIECH